MDDLNFFVPMISRKLAYSIIGVTLREYPALFLSEDITIQGSEAAKTCCLRFRVKNADQLRYVIDSFYIDDLRWDPKIRTDEEYSRESRLNQIGQ
jgi:hypothetical protein